MKRSEFISSLATMPLLSSSMNMKYLEDLSSSLHRTDLMPILFLGHGSPMNAIEDNEFVRGFKNLTSQIPKPQAILCISAHWETKGTYITAMDFPRTIHDFGGFPKELYNVRYNAPGNPDLATFISKEVRTTTIGLDHSWGLDHGAWSVIKHVYPKADIPVLELSLDYTKDPFYHYSLAKQLSFLRTKGVLIIGSGNIVHNLSKVAWNKLDEPNYAYDWALEARTIINTAIIDGNHNKLIDYHSLGTAISLAIPTPEHFLPLLYILALQQKSEPLMLFNDKALGGSLTMTSLKIG
jgi:4,5-DOPA dioxygenase extradiol